MWLLSSSEANPGCTAHISAVAQHDCALLNLNVVQGALLTEDSQRAMAVDILDPQGVWGDAAIYTVVWNENFEWNCEDAANRNYDEGRMCRFRVRKVVLIDSATKLPILAWAHAVVEHIARGLRSHFQPLDQAKGFRFRLHRKRHGFCLEKPGTEQRMEMVRHHCWQVCLLWLLTAVAGCLCGTDWRPCM